MQHWTESNIQYLKGVGPGKAGVLAKLGIITVADLLEHYPKRYEDRSQLKSIGHMIDGETETFRGVITAIEETKPRRGLVLTKVTVTDGTQPAKLVWFNQPFIKKKIKIGDHIVATGKVKRQFQIEIANPEFEVISNKDMVNTGRIVPVYAANDSISQNFLRGLVQQALAYNEIPETLPQEIITQYNLMSRKKALEFIHFPESMTIWQQARYRLAFEELYFLQCAFALLRKQSRQGYKGIKHAPDGNLVKMVENKLPFTLTPDQKKVLQEIKGDMEDVIPMQRLLQGDVGAGKTVIAAIALVKTVENGYQGAMMAPTEILAEQHYCTLTKLLSPLGINVGLLSGKLSRRAKDLVLEQIQQGLFNIVVGTHALIQDTVAFQELGLVITDEQHRFGVNQRAKLQDKGNRPDVLVMTATPIPRTMALTVYGDLDVSQIRQLPPGRKQIRTFVRGREQRKKVYEFVVQEINRGRQAYIVCPLIEESEKVDAQAAVQLYEELTTTVFQGISCGLLHGKLKSREKEEIMAAFYSSAVKIIVATTVIEVGVNVPNATVMVIEAADRFGLAQLHQLRGRIGRGEHQSYCILLSESKSRESKERLGIMVSSNDGFVLAEEDLKLRGPGQFFGLRQHGMPDLKIADVVNDVDILLCARNAAQQTMNNSMLRQAAQGFLLKRLGDEFTNGLCS